MNILEKEIEDVIWDCINGANIDTLTERGIKNLSYDYQYFRQPNLGDYGIADIVGVDVLPSTPGTAVNFSHARKFRQIKFQVIELKKDKIDHNTVLQAIRYAAGLQSTLVNETFFPFRVSYQIILIGKAVDIGSLSHLLRIYDNITVYTYSISLDKGIVFKRFDDYDELDCGDNFRLGGIISDMVSERVDISRWVHKENLTPRREQNNLDNPF